VGTLYSGLTPFITRALSNGCDIIPGVFFSWLAGAGVQRGYVHGTTDEIGLWAAEKPVHVRDFHATILHLMGFDHQRLTYRHAGLDFRLTGVEEAHVVQEILC
ncbi:MAG TPA: DUF1501 domain-containing protein, partial [Planctomycetaceae bacterium]|nr:DUF1501 domain-containing protein [Planctomycetaceae bacterium]